MCTLEELPRGPEFEVIRSIIGVVFPGLLDGRVVQLELALVLASLAIGLARFRLASMDRIIQRCSKRPAAAFAI